MAGMAENRTPGLAGREYPQWHGAEIHEHPLTFETCLDSLRAIGDDETATTLHERYLDFGEVEAAIFSG